MRSYTHHRFILLVVGGSSTGRRAIRNFRHLAEAAFKEDYQLEIIDVRSHPEKAEEYKILAVPTLLRLAPQPHLKIVGDLSDTQRLKTILGIDMGVEST